MSSSADAACLALPDDESAIGDDVRAVLGDATGITYSADDDAAAREALTRDLGTARSDVVKFEQDATTAGAPSAVGQALETIMAGTETALNVENSNEVGAGVQTIQLGVSSLSATDRALAAFEANC